jgi:hypothetical protein
MMNRTKQAMTPSEGIYYVIPDERGQPSVVAQRTDETEDEPVHMFFWDKVLILLAHKMPESDLNPLRGHYLALPRGRIQKEYDLATHKYTGGYVILHGGEVPTRLIQYAVFQDFGLNQLSSLGKVKWSVNQHEKVNEEDEKIYQEILNRAAVKKVRKDRKGKS